MTSTHIIVCQIERIVHPTSFRKTPWAKFQTPAGYFLVDAWFEDGQPKMQIRSNVESDNPLEVAVIVAQAIHMAVDWLMEMTDAGRNVPRREDSK